MIYTRSEIFFTLHFRTFKQMRVDPSENQVRAARVHGFLLNGLIPIADINDIVCSYIKYFEGFELTKKQQKNTSTQKKSYIFLKTFFKTFFLKCFFSSVWRNIVEVATIPSTRKPEQSLRKPLRGCGHKFVRVRTDKPVRPRTHRPAEMTSAQCAS